MDFLSLKTNKILWGPKQVAEERLNSWADLTISSQIWPKSLNDDDDIIDIFTDHKKPISINTYRRADRGRKCLQIHFIYFVKEIKINIIYLRPTMKVRAVQRAVGRRQSVRVCRDFVCSAPGRRTPHYALLHCIQSVQNVWTVARNRVPYLTNSCIYRIVMTKSFLSKI